MGPGRAIRDPIIVEVVSFTFIKDGSQTELFTLHEGKSVICGRVSN